ncbi:MAG: MFS transporter [Mangrovibacterium sp.]
MIKVKLNNFPFAPSQLSFFYGWVILMVGTFGVLMSSPGQTSGVSTFTDYLIGVFDISRDQLSLCYMAGTIVSSLVLTSVGRLYDRWGARWVSMLAGVLLGLVLIYMSQSDIIAQYFRAQLHLPKESLWVGFLVLGFGFFVLRLAGQGALTVVSRNMIMKWFVLRRGWASGVSNVFVAVGFSLVPLFFDKLIMQLGWRNAWIYVGLFSIFFFVLVAFIFFRDNPEDCGLKPDGNYEAMHENKDLQLMVKKQFSLSEARHTLIFWIYAIPMAIYAMIVTGFTFNVISIFEKAGMWREDALFVFFPAAIISTIVTLAGGYLSDQIRLKWFLLVFLLAMAGFNLCLALLGSQGAYIGLILTYGVSTGLYSLLISIAWPRFFGRENLGAISGFSMSLVVFLSAIGPILFSSSLSYLGSYGYAAMVCVLVCVLAFVLALRTVNPQEVIKD